MDNINSRQVWYSLRRTLPPWNFQQMLDELCRLAPRFRIDEVIVKIDTEEFSHGHPTLEWARAYQPKLFLVKKELERLGIVYSLNPWITVGHADRGRDDRKRLPGLECAVGHDGVEARHCACFLSPVWREHIRKLWTIYAETHPHIMWVEDDIRTFNHEPVEFGCFCPRHMKRFSERVGREVSREELVRAILQPGKPHPWRREYLLMQREIMIETVAFLAKVTHETSPETCMGLMSSGPRLHCVEGRAWKRLGEALADGRPLYSRPPMGNYCEDSLRGFYYSQDSIKLTRHVLPQGTIEQTECENVPFTRYSKSVVFTFLELAVSVAYGSPGITLNLFDHAGRPMEDEAHFGVMLAERKPFLNELAVVAQQPGSYAGVQLCHRDDYSLCKELEPGAAYRDLQEDGYPLMCALESAGIPTTYDESNIFALNGQSARAIPEDELRRRLTGGMLLDGVAAKVLLERGFGDQIGLKRVGEPMERRQLPWVVSAEEFHNTEFGGAPRKYLTATLPFLSASGRICLLEAADSAQVISSWVDPDTSRKAPAMIAFENAEGGRVIVHGMEYQSCCGVAFNHPFRREQLQNVVRYLGKGKEAITFRGDGAYPLAWRRDMADVTVVGCFNLNLDSWRESIFDLYWSKPVPRILYLSADGDWLAAEGAVELNAKENRLTIVWRREVDHRLPLVLKLV